MALFVVAEAIDHPDHHVVDGDIGRDRRIALREFLEDQHRIAAAQPGSANVLFAVDAAEPEFAGLPEHVDRKMFALVPLNCMGGKSGRGELPHRRNELLLVFRLGIHGQCIIGIVKLAPSLMPDGQREVTVLVFV